MLELEPGLNVRIRIAGFNVGKQMDTSRIRLA